MGSNNSRTKESAAGSNVNGVALTPSQQKYFADTPQANFSQSESSNGDSKPVQPSETTLSASSGDTAAEKVKKYLKFRDELLAFSLGEPAFDYAERLFKEHPSSPEVMALLAETTTLYDLTKNKHQRSHWVDRLDLLQRGIDVSRKCIKENPEYGPCYRTYVMCAVRASESLYYYRWMRSVGLLENYCAIIKRGEEGLKHMPDDPEITKSLGMLACRCAYNWYNPYRALGWMYGVPSKRELYAQGIQYLKRSTASNPDSMETACRLGMAYFQAGDFPNARRWYCKVRDEMRPQDLKDERWQSIAHTQLSTGFIKPKWNVPFA